MTEKTWLQSSNMLTDGYGTVYYARTVKDARRLREILVSQTYGLNALTSERDEAVREKEKLVGAVEKLTNLIDGHDWLADGRGPYRYDDGRYDDEVMAFVTSLREALEPGRWRGWQDLINAHDEAVRVAGELRAKAGLADWWGEPHLSRPLGDIARAEEVALRLDVLDNFRDKTASVPVERTMQRDIRAWLRDYTASLTASTGGSSDEPQKEIRE